MPTALEDGIDWGTQLGSNAVTYHFAETGTYDGVTATSWNNYEKQQFELAFALYESFTNLTFTEVASGQDLTLVRGGDMGRTLGWFGPPGHESAGIGAFNGKGTGWEENKEGYGGLEQGGYGFITIIHELGHGLGLAHPHDTGGTSSKFPGVSGPFGDYGDYGLNQGVYTIMSYNDGWRTNPDGRTPDRAYGYQGTPMAIDIAVLQAKYGANMSYNTGNDQYVLPDTNDSGTFHACIWDADGVDTIVNNGAGSSVIDLRAATLEVEEGGGGFISYADGIFGGFTIAKGVVIENAIGGSGADTLIGNAAANELTGNDGSDTLDGRGGGDMMAGGDGGDTYVVNHSGDVVDEAGSQGNDLVEASITFSLADAVHAKGDVENLTLLGGDDIDGAGNDLKNIITGNSGKNLLEGGKGGDELRGARGKDKLEGGNGKDTLAGGAGPDKLDGGKGDDLLNGGKGTDQYLFTVAPGNGVDTIAKLQAGEKIRLDDAGFTAIGGPGTLQSDYFVKGSKAKDGDDHIVYKKKDGKIFYDEDGAGGDGKILFAKVDKGTQLDHTDFVVI